MTTRLAARIRNSMDENSNDLTVIDVHTLIEAIGEHLREYPDDIEEIIPGFCLAPRKMSRSERSSHTVSAMNAARSVRRQDHIDMVAPHIKAILKADPAISRRELGRQLDAAGIKPPRGKNWSVSSLTLILKEL